jgi:uncharacterized membrane protein YkvA (DUF1232 family)
MDKKSNKSLIPSQGGMFSDLLVRVKLIGKLMADRRVKFWLKLIPVGTLAYLVLPIDLIPGGVIPLVGAVDDVAIIWFGASMFIELCPPEIVREHMRQLTSNSDIVDNASRDVDVIDAEVTDIPENPDK